MRNTDFGHLLTGAINSIAAYEAKTAAAVEIEFGEKLGVASSSIQRYKSRAAPARARDGGIPLRRSYPARVSDP
jgi:hypothetical protein